MNKRANLYFAALLGAMSPLCTVSALAAQSNSTIATATQQQNSCTGTVKDATGEPIIGATIRIEGKTGGTVTDLDGNFTLSNIEKGAKLTITYVGYKSQTLTWSGSPLNITLQDDANMLEETVVIGYGTVKKADLAGSVAVLDSKSFKDQPVARVEDALNGRMSGVQVMSSGVPGGAMKIRVRGASSVNKSNDPLYVVDGIVRETGLEGISPEDIQSIQVLKDASSTAIYGARGANGVVMVQTKTGKAGATQVTFDGSFGFSNAYHIPEAMSTKQYAQALVDHKGVSQSAVQDYLNGTKAGIDWMDELLQTYWRWTARPSRRIRSRSPAGGTTVFPLSTGWCSRAAWILPATRAKRWKNGRRCSRRQATARPAATACCWCIKRRPWARICWKSPPARCWGCRTLRTNWQNKLPARITAATGASGTMSS